MTYKEAVELLAYRDHIVDLERALALIGFRVEPQSSSTVTDADATDDPELDVEVAEGSVSGIDSSRHGHGSRGEANASPTNPLFDGGDSIDDPMWFNSVQLASRTMTRSGASAAGLGPEDAPSTDWQRYLQSVESEVMPSTAELAALVTQSTLRDELRPRSAAKSIDVMPTVELMARRKVIRRVPRQIRRRRPTHVQLVRDIAIAVGPFRQDADALSRQISRLWPSAICSEVNADVSLYSGINVTAQDGYRYHPPAGTRLVLVFVSGGSGETPGLRFDALDAAIRRARRRGHVCVGVWFGDHAAAKRVDDVRSRWIAVTR
ncbi:hypothetical protein AU195_20570 [Mycobacterium sp. IS-1496]|uniref:hypothetical protein n=1 Tax=Mycobacterium sp. IS-1496 TaxID=1772284 RepID=UPI00074180E3|nr:hypothetical protein [Mycobacterium sp. IS-1496]KUI28157.1 hypothetical protein AU195_20570 [Mycobacterium sp. IS-1496]